VRGLGALRDGVAGPFTAAAAAVAAFGVLVLLLALQLPSSVYLTGRAVEGVNDGGLIYYQVDGSEYTLDAVGDPPASPEPATVYVARDDPSQALADRPGRWLDLGFVGAPFATALVLLVWGQARRVRRRRRQEPLVPLSWFVHRPGPGSPGGP
jgi:hypothetical protein